MITFDQFKAMDIRTVKILEATDHPNADKLYVVKVQDGENERQVVAGIKQFYTKEELVGKQVIALVNLQPATIRGVESNGMILATKDDEKLAILTPEKEVKIGSKVS